LTLYIPDMFADRTGRRSRKIH